MSGCQPLRAPNHQLQICDGFISLPAYFHPQDTEAAVIVVEGDALYDVGDLLGRGSALKHGGIHVGIGGHPSESRFRGDSAAGRGLGRFLRFNPCCGALGPVRRAIVKVVQRLE
jgi:hypothetical protein